MELADETPAHKDQGGINQEGLEELSHLMPALWRTLVRATKSAERVPALESQVSILRRLVSAGPMPPAQLADELHLARPTISNLLKGLQADGYVERRPSDTDGRSVVLAATPLGRGVLDDFRRGRREVLEEAVSRLGDRDRDRIVAALPSLEVLLRQLEELAGDAPM